MLEQNLQQKINPLAIQVMREYGIDISKQRPKIITEDMIRNADYQSKYGMHG